MFPSHRLAPALLVGLLAPALDAGAAAGSTQDPAPDCAPSRAAVEPDKSGSAWVLVDLPLGSWLDLGRGLAVDQVPADGAWLTGPQEGMKGSVLLHPLPGAAARGPSVVVGRSAVEGAQPGLPYHKGARTGDEFAWRRADPGDPGATRAWGYLRVVELRREGALLEVWRADGDQLWLRREPSVLSVDAGPGGYSLSWDAGEYGGPWRVERRIVDGGPASFELVAEAAAPRHDDVDAPRDRLVEWRVSRADAPGIPGALVRATRVVHAGEWPLSARVGERIDLLTGAQGTSTAHVEVTYVTPPTATLRPLNGTLFQRLGSPSSWRLPDAIDFDPESEGRVRPLVAGTEVAVLTREGVVVRLSARAEEGGGLEFYRESALRGEPLLPRPPPRPEVRYAAPDGDALFELLFGPPPVAAEFPDDLALVVERELRARSDDWEVVLEGAPGTRFLELSLAALRAGDPAAVHARVRFRQRFAFGAASLPTAPRDLLLVDPADAAARAALLDAAVRDLDHPDWARRIEARDVLGALGADALPRLEELLVSGSEEARGAARELLAGGAAGGSEGLARLYVIEARAAGLPEPDPGGPLADLLDGLVDPRPAYRAHALLLALDRAELRGDSEATSQALGWAQLVARYDAARPVRAFADLVALLPASGGPLPVAGELTALVPPERRRAGALRPLGDTSLPLSARTLVAQLGAAPGLAELDTGPVLASMIDELERSAATGSLFDRVPDYDLSTADLALQLIERYEAGGDVRLLEAARGLYPGWAGTFAGWRTATLRRAADPWAQAALSDVPRRRIVLEDASLTALQGALVALRDDRARYVDVVLPAGDYRPDISSQPGGADYVELDVPGLRLVADGDVHLDIGLRVQATRDVVLDGLTVEHRAGVALIVLDGGHVVVRGGAILGAGTGVQVQDSDVELLGTVVGDLALGRPGQWSLRHLGRGRLVARATLFTGGSLYVGDRAEPVLDRCVVDAGERPILQAQRDGGPIVRESLLLGDSMGLVNVTGGCLAGVVLDAARDALGARPGDLRVDPRWFALTGADARVPQELRLARSPLERD